MAYDIRSPRRLAWVAKALTEAGYRQQYSVFAADLTEPARARLVARLRKLVDPAEDDLRFYLVPDQPRGGWPCQVHGEILGIVPCNDLQKLQNLGVKSLDVSPDLKGNETSSRTVCNNDARFDVSPDLKGNETFDSGGSPTGWVSAYAPISRGMKRTEGLPHHFHLAGGEAPLFCFRSRVAPGPLSGLSRTISPYR